MTGQHPSNPAFPGPDHQPRQVPHQPGGMPSGINGLTLLAVTVGPDLAKMTEGWTP